MKRRSFLRIWLTYFKLKPYEFHKLMGWSMQRLNYLLDPDSGFVFDNLDEVRTKTGATWKEVTDLQKKYFEQRPKKRS